MDIREKYPLGLAAQLETEAMPHLQGLKCFALHLARNQTEAEDLVQETLAQALKSFDRYELGTNCRAWLCRIMVNKRSQWIRANARFCQFDETEFQIPAVPTYILPPRFMSANVSQSLGKLPEKFRGIVWFADVEELTYREIAEQFDIPIGTVMSRLHRGRAMLRRNYFAFAVKDDQSNKNSNLSIGS